jgi:hypothetical protein
MLTPTQTRCIAALLVERTEKAACLVAGVSDRTLRRWQQEKEFQEALAAEQSKLVAGVVNQIIGASAVLARRLHELADNPNLPTDEVIKLITWALPLAVELHDRQALLARIATLEKLHDNPAPQWRTIEGDTCQKQIS